MQRTTQGRLQLKVAVTDGAESDEDFVNFSVGPFSDSVANENVALGEPVFLNGGATIPQSWPSCGLPVRHPVAAGRCRRPACKRRCASSRPSFCYEEQLRRSRSMATTFPRVAGSARSCASRIGIRPASPSRIAIGLSDSSNGPTRSTNMRRSDSASISASDARSTYEQGPCSSRSSRPGTTGRWWATGRACSVRSIGSPRRPSRSTCEGARDLAPTAGRGGRRPGAAV